MPMNVQYKMKKLNSVNIIIIVLCLFFVIYMSAIFIGMYNSSPAQTSDKNITTVSKSGDFSEINYKLKNGETVKCILYKSNYKSGLSCDWDQDY